MKAAFPHGLSRHKTYQGGIKANIAASLSLCGICHVITDGHHHYRKYQGLDPLIRSVSRVTTVLANVSSVFQLFSFLVVCSDIFSKGFCLVALFASVKVSFICIYLSCLICIQSVVHGVRSRLFCGHKWCSLMVKKLKYEVLVVFNSIMHIPNFVEIGKLVQQLIMKTHSLVLLRIDISL
jgi:hypothetical protein